jgi:Ca2+-binding RTX toxin-like protein
MSIPMSSYPLDSQIQEVFRDECRAILKAGGDGIRLDTESLRLLPGFAEHYRSLRALPRRTRRSLERRWKRRLGAIALLITLGQAPALAATIGVSAGTPPPINADGRCSLVEAIVNANNDSRTYADCGAGAGPDTILLPSNSTQPINETLTITSPVIVEGRGSTIASGGSSGYLPRMIEVFAPGDLTLNRTTLSGASGSAPAGIVVYAEGGATLRQSTVSDIELQGSGVGIANRGGSLTLVNSLVLRNGLGILNEFDRGFPGTATLIRSTVASNVCYDCYESPGITNLSGADLTLIRSTVSGNRAPNDLSYGGYVLRTGGGIFNSGTARLFNSTVSGNEGNYGGGVANFWGGTLVLASSTVTGNRATSPYAFYGADVAGGLYVHSGDVTLIRSIVSGNTVARPQPGREIASTGVITADNYNLFGHDGDAGIPPGFSPGPTDIVPDVPIDAILVALANNGGGMQTHALAIGSPALDASPDDNNCPPIDQRGNPRPQGSACDIGSFEGSAVRCNGRVTTMVGTAQRDVLRGTPGPDVIHGLDGNDLISGLEGNDTICGGGGPDIVWAGPGNDLVIGGWGADLLYGNTGRDSLNGGTGNDVCNGGAPNTEPGDTAVNCETVDRVP